MAPKRDTLVGILGGGQLGRMLALAGYPLGLKFRFLDPAADAPAGHVAPLIIGDYDDARRLDEFGGGLSVVTYEFENVPLNSLRFLGRNRGVHPNPPILEISQDRQLEKEFFQRLEIPTTRFAPVSSEEELAAAVELIGLPAILKTRRFGYDGKGQSVIRDPHDLEPAWAEVGGVPCILEAVVEFHRELSILAVRGGAIRGDEGGWKSQAAFYPLVENLHRGGILRRSIAPAPDLPISLQRQAEDYALRVMEAVEYFGVLAIEFFEIGGELIANEMAPRVHNSGHWTIEGAETSQFENHLRAILGWNIGSTAPRGYAAMFNIIGEMPPREKLLGISGAHAHIYGKEPHPGRKIGHVTVCAETLDELRPRIAELEAALSSH